MAVTDTGSERVDRRRDFSLYWIAVAADNLGSHAASLVFPLVVLGIGGSPGQAGLVGTVGLAARVAVSPFAGVYADRWPRRRVMVWSAVAAAVAVGSVFLALAFDTTRLAHLVGATAVEGVASGFYTAAASGTVRRVVAPEDYPKAVSRLEAGDYGARLVGPPVGGALFGLARFAPFLLDTLSYLVAAVCVRAIGTDLTPDREGEHPSLLGDLRAGWRFVWTTPLLRFVAAWATAVTFVFAALIYHATLTFRLAGASALSISVVLTLSSVGGLVGALLAPRIAARAGALLLVVGASWAMAVLVVGLGFAGSTWLYGILLASVFVCFPALGVVFSSRVIAVTPDSFQGRVGTVLGTFPESVAVLAPIAAGVAVGRFGQRPLALVFAGVLGVLALYSTVRFRALMGAGPGVPTEPAEQAAQAAQADLAEAAEAAEPPVRAGPAATAASAAPPVPAAQTVEVPGE